MHQHSFENKPQEKILFDRICKKWQGLIESLHKEDRELLLKMVTKICNYNECSASITNIQDSESNISYFFFMLLVIEQQKLIDNMDKRSGIKVRTNITLLDYLS